MSSPSKPLLAAVLALAGLVLAAGPVHAKELRGLVSWPPVLQIAHIWPEFGKRVEAASNGALTLTRSGPEVVPPFEQIEPLQNGLFHVLLTTGGYHAGTTPILSTFDAILPDPAKIRATGLFDWADRFYQEKLGVKLLAIVPTGAYQIMTTERPSAGRLDGMKIRGTSVYHPLIRNLGASPVVLPAREVFPALQKGVVDGIAWPRYAVAMFKMYEAGLKFSMRPYYGQATAGILVNLETFQALPKDQQAVLVEQGRAVETWALGYYERVIDEEAALLASKGVEYIDWGPTAGNIRKWFADGVWDNAARIDPENVAAFKALVTTRGMMND